MEILLENTDIFDLDLYDKVERVIQNGSFDIEAGEEYKLEVIFHVNHINTDKMDEYFIRYVHKEPIINNKKKYKTNYMKSSNN